MTDPESTDYSGQRSFPTGFVLAAAGLVAAAIGILTLLGWVFGWPLLVSFGTGLIPMAPTTAILLLGYGVAVAWRAPRKLSRGSFRFSTTVGWLGTAIALVLFALRCLGLSPGFEHLGLNLSTTANGTPVGLMSPVTAMGFLLVGLSFLASLSWAAIPRWRNALATGAASLLLGISFVFLLAYLYGMPLLYGSGFIPPAFSSILGFLALGLALLILGRPAPGCRPTAEPGFRTAFAFILIFLVLAVGIMTASYLYYRQFERTFLSATDQELSAVADLKVEELALYRRERLGDGAVMFQNPSVSALVRRFLEVPEDQEARRFFQTWISKYEEYYHYDLVCLLDTKGATRLCSPAGRAPVSSSITQRLPELFGSGQMSFQDLHRNEYNQQAYLDILVPLFDETEARRPLAVFDLRIDPTTYLYPFIRRWPTPSRTGVTILVRREGNEVVYLNDLQYRSNSAPVRRIPLAQTNLVSTKAILELPGLKRGNDYRGVPVFAATRAVPGSPWYLVAKKDQAEVYGPLRERLWQVVGMMAVLLLSAGASVGLVWRQQRLRFYREQAATAESLRASRSTLNLILHTVPQSIFWKDIDGCYLGCNRAFAAAVGLDHPSAIVGKTDFDLPGSRTQAEAYRAEDREVVSSGNPKLHIIEKARLADGSWIWAETCKLPLLDAQGKATGVLGVYEDITQRRREEAALQSSLEEKTALLKEIHHRVKNNLQVVSSLLRLQSRQIDNAEVRAALEDTNARVRSMAMVHEHFYQSTNLAQVDLAGYLKSLCTQLFHALVLRPGAVRLDLDLVPVRLGIEQAIPCGLLVNELVSNCFKHAFPERASGVVRVELQPVPDRPALRLRVADNGVGLPAGLNLKGLKSLGLELVSTLARQLGGRLEIGPGPGAAFEVIFPLKPTGSSPDPQTR